MSEAAREAAGDPRLESGSEHAADQAAERGRRAREMDRRRKAKKRRRKLAAWLAVSLATPVIRLLASTWRVEREGEFDPHPGRPRMFAVWHGRLLLPLPIHSGRDTRVLVSASEDGSIITSFLERLGFGVVRGSSHRRGAVALRNLLRELGAGVSVAITPDGPRGPRHSVAAGVVWLARSSGLPVIPVGLAAKWAWTLGTWDRFTIPLPFSRVAVTYGPAIELRESEGSLDLDQQRIQAALLAAEQRSFERLGREPDW